MKKEGLIWQDKRGLWCCYQKNDIKVYKTKKEAEAAANRSLGTSRGSRKRSENKISRDEEWVEHVEDKYGKFPPK